MIKIINLGYEVPETGEARVELISEGLVKTASNEIQQYWSKLDKHPDKAYLHVIAMTDSSKYGPNNNGDWFDGQDLRKYHPTFVENAHVYLHHVNKDPKKSIGKPIYSFYNENMHRVELILELDKKSSLAQETIRKIKDGEQIFVSMGVHVSHDVCSICANSAKTRKEYCEHLRYNMKKILPDGRQVYAINPAPLKFFDISVVHRPADKVAWALDKAASEGGLSDDSFSEKTSAELGEDYERRQACLAGLRKLSEMIKQVDGDVVELKDGDESVNVLRRMKDLKIKHLDYPTLEPEAMDSLKVTPGCMLRSILGHGVAPSLGEIVHMAGRNSMGDDFKKEHIPSVLQLLPSVLGLLLQNPERILPEMSSVYDNYQDELGNPEIVIRISRTVAPMAAKRTLLIKQACDMRQLEKLAAPVLESLQEPKAQMDLARGSSVQRWASNVEGRSWSPHGPGLAESFHVSGPDGRVLTTNRAAAMTAQDMTSMADIGKRLLGVTVGAAALGAAVSEPSLLRLLLTVPALGFLASHLMKGIDPKSVRTMEGVEIPVGTVFSQSLGKTAAIQDIFKAKPEHIAPLLGMAVPTGLGLDYLYNKHIKYRGEQTPEAYMSPLKRKMYAAGKGVTEHPFLSLATGAVVGGTLRAQAAKSGRVPTA